VLGHGLHHPSREWKEREVRVRSLATESLATSQQVNGPWGEVFPYSLFP